LRIRGFSSRLWFAGLVLLVISLAACTPIPSTNLTPAVSEPEVEQVNSTEEINAIESYPAPEDVQPDGQVYPAPEGNQLSEQLPQEASPYPIDDSQVVQPIPVAMPTPRPELQATDPASVQLSSGRLQLVEFFAFW